MEKGQKRAIPFDAGLFLFALGLRLVFLAYWQWKDIGETYGRDLYYQQALAWLGWRPLTWMDATHPPVYTLFITAVLGVFRTENPMPVMLIQCLLSSATCVLVRRLGTRLASERVGRVAALWAAIDLPMIFFVPQLQTETFFIFLETVFFVWLYASLSETKLHAGNAWSLGVFGGASALCRSAFAAYPVFLLLTLARMKELANRKAFFLLVCVGWASPIALWTARNWVLYKKVIPISAQMGWNLYEGFTLDRETVRRHPFEMDAEAKRLGLTDPLDISDHFKKKVFAYVREHPFESAKIVVGKAFLYWRPWVYDPYTPAQRVLMTVYFCALFGFALAGVWISRSDAKAWWPVYGVMLYFTASHAVFATFARYRLPLEPFLCLLGAVGASGLWERWNSPGKPDILRRSHGA